MVNSLAPQHYMYFPAHVAFDYSISLNDHMLCKIHEYFENISMKTHFINAMMVKCCNELYESQV
jgi:hypothetical protein